MARKKPTKPKRRPAFMPPNPPVTTNRKIRSPKGNPTKNGEVFGSYLPRKRITKVRSN